MGNSPDIKPKIRNRINYCRMAKNLSQKEAAFLMGVPPPQVSKWETGETEPGVYNAIGLAVTTGKPVEDIYLDYYEEWQEKIAEREKLLTLEKNGNPE
jgi:transcriptional regulator with XRE-family HTH domain